MKIHTITREVGIDTEVSVDGQDYYALIEADVEYDSEAEPQDVAIMKCEVSRLDGELLPWKGDKKRLEQFTINGLPELSDTLNDLLWQEVRDYAENNAAEIARDVEDDYEEGASFWNSDE